MLKEGIRVIAFEGSPITRNKDKALVVGIIGRQDIIEGVISFHADVDGTDATAKIAKAIERSRFGEGIRLIALNSVTLAGLNLIDTVKLNNKTRLPIVAITRKRPDREGLARAIRAGSPKTAKEKLGLLEKNSHAMKNLGEKGFHIQYIGIERSDVSRTLRMCSELLRLAHLVASGVVSGESRGRL